MCGTILQYHLGGVHSVAGAGVDNCLLVHNFMCPSPQIPNAIESYSLDIPVQQGRLKLREVFIKNGHVRDPRVIDMLVIKVGSS